VSQGHRPHRTISPAGAERKPTAEELRRRQVYTPPPPPKRNPIRETHGRLIDIASGIKRLKGQK
jgi:transposase